MVAPAANPLALGAMLDATYRHFYDSAYAIADPDLADERRALMQGEARMSGECLLEPVPPYRSSGLTIAQAAMTLDLPEAVAADVAAFLEPLIPGGELYTP